MTFQREHDGHLSGFKVSRAAMGQSTPDVDAHLATCAHCVERVASERAEVQAATLEPVPARVLAATPAPKRRPWWLWVGPLVAAAAAVMIVVAMPRGEVGEEGFIRAKGGITIEATVARGEAIIVSDVALDAVGELAAGDKLLLRVNGAEGQHAKVESFESGAWVVVHESVVVSEGWLPLALKITPGETRLRVSVCADATPRDCFEQVQTLDVK